MKFYALPFSNESKDIKISYEYDFFMKFSFLMKKIEKLKFNMIELSKLKNEIFNLIEKIEILLENFNLENEEDILMSELSYCKII